MTRTPSRNQIRLRALRWAGWDEKYAKRHVRKHKTPLEGVEILALIWWELKKIWRGIIN